MASVDNVLLRRSSDCRTMFSGARCHRSTSRGAVVNATHRKSPAVADGWAHRERSRRIYTQICQALRTAYAITSSLLSRSLRAAPDSISTASFGGVDAVGSVVELVRACSVQSIPYRSC